MAAPEYIAGQGVRVRYVDTQDGGRDVLGRCSVIDCDNEAETVSVLTKYEDRGSRRFVKDIPWGSVEAADPKRPHGGDGAHQGAHGAIERVAGRIMRHSEKQGAKMGRDDALDRARTIAARNHGGGVPGRRAQQRERE